MFAITTAHSHLEPGIHQIASRWKFQVIPWSKKHSEPFYLELTDRQLQLVQTGNNMPGPIAVNFSSAQMTYRRRFGGGKSQIIAKAAGLNKTPSALIFDATAGLGKDAFILASLGAKILLMERSTLAAALLEDGLKRARQEEELSEIIQRMYLVYGNSHQLLCQFRQLKLPEPFCHAPEVIYLDPMYPQRHKSALVKKEMLAFQQLLGFDTDCDGLLEISCQTALKRVVVKRPIKAAYLGQRKPSFSLCMKKHRFDIYLS